MHTIIQDDLPIYAKWVWHKCHFWKTITFQDTLDIAPQTWNLFAIDRHPKHTFTKYLWTDMREHCPLLLWWYEYFPYQLRCLRCSRVHDSHKGRDTLSLRTFKASRQYRKYHEDVSSQVLSPSNWTPTLCYWQLNKQNSIRLRW